MKAGQVALSVPMAPGAAPLAAYQAVSLAVLLLLLVAGVALGLLITGDVAVAVPRELLHAADRIQRGDFAARVAPLAGSMGTVGAALNRAADAAEQALARHGAGEAPGAAPASAEPDPFALPPLSHAAARPAPQPGRPASAPEASISDLFAPPPEAPAEQPPAAPFPPLGNSVSGATSLATRPEDLVQPGEPPVRQTFEAERTPPPVLAPTPPPVRAPTPPPPAAVPPAPTPPPVPGATLPPDRTAPWPTPPPTRTPAPGPTPAPAPTSGPSRTPPLPTGQPRGPAALGDPDAEHWNEVFQDFLRIRAACGETTQGLTAERFMAKLQSNRAALMQKHDCRTVRFQVYVKEGRAAIKATPVK
jgi:hypothetical protein